MKVIIQDKYVDIKEPSREISFTVRFGKFERYFSNDELNSNVKLEEFDTIPSFIKVLLENDDTLESDEFQKEINELIENIENNLSSKLSMHVEIFNYTHHDLYVSSFDNRIFKLPAFVPIENVFGNVEYPYERFRDKIVFVYKSNSCLNEPNTFVKSNASGNSYLSEECRKKIKTTKEYFDDIKGFSIVSEVDGKKFDETKDLVVFNEPLNLYISTNKDVLEHTLLMTTRKPINYSSVSNVDLSSQKLDSQISCMISTISQSNSFVLNNLENDLINILYYFDGNKLNKLYNIKDKRFPPGLYYIFQDEFNEKTIKVRVYDIKTIQDKLIDGCCVIEILGSNFVFSTTEDEIMNFVEYYGVGTPDSKSDNVNVDESIDVRVKKISKLEDTIDNLEKEKIELKNKIQFLTVENSRLNESNKNLNETIKNLHSFHRTTYSREYNESKINTEDWKLKLAIGTTIVSTILAIYKFSK